MRKTIRDKNTQCPSYQSAATVSLVESVPEMEFTAGVDAGHFTSLQSRKTDCYIFKPESVIYLSMIQAIRT